MSRTKEALGKPGAADFDERRWPIHAAILALAMVLSGLVVAKGDFHEPRLFYNGWTHLALVAGLAWFLLASVRWLEKLILRRTLFCVVVAVLVEVVFFAGLNLISWATLVASVTPVAVDPTILPSPESQSRSPLPPPDVRWDQPAEPADSAQLYVPVETPLPTETLLEPPGRRGAAPSSPSPLPPDRWQAGLPAPPPALDSPGVGEPPLAVPARKTHDATATELANRQPGKHASLVEEVIPLPKPAAGRRASSPLPTRPAETDHLRGLAELPSLRPPEQTKPLSLQLPPGIDVAMVPPPRATPPLRNERANPGAGLPSASPQRKTPAALLTGEAAQPTTSGEAQAASSQPPRAGKGASKEPALADPVVPPARRTTSTDQSSQVVSVTWLPGMVLPTASGPREMMPAAALPAAEGIAEPALPEAIVRRVPTSERLEGTVGWRSGGKNGAAAQRPRPAELLAEPAALPAGAALPLAPQRASKPPDPGAAITIAGPALPPVKHATPASAPSIPFVPLPASVALPSTVPPNVPELEAREASPLLARHAQLTDREGSGIGVSGEGGQGGKNRVAGLPGTPRGAIALLEEQAAPPVLPSDEPTGAPATAATAQSPAGGTEVVREPRVPLGRASGVHLPLGRSGISGNGVAFASPTEIAANVSSLPIPPTQSDIPPAIPRRRDPQGIGDGSAGASSGAGVGQPTASGVRRKTPSDGPLSLDGTIATPMPSYQHRESARGAEGGRGLVFSAGDERIVLRALDYFARLQFPDGRWSLHSLPSGAHGDDPALGTIEADTAATGLALLTYLGAGYTHLEGKYRAIVSRGLEWLVQNQKSNGDLFTGGSKYATFYSQGIATMALCEAYGMTQDPKLRQPAKAAIDYIVQAQHPQRGGWRYTPRAESDTSVSGWLLQALKSAQMAGLPVPAETLSKVDLWLNLAQAPGGRYVYNPFADPHRPEQAHGRRPNLAMTAEGMLMRMYLGYPRNNPNLIAGAEYLKQNLPQLGTAEQPLRDSYYWYYATQAMFYMRQDYWPVWRNQMMTVLENTQEKEGPWAGSWHPQRPVPDLWGHAGGRLYVTAMHLLMIEVYYRHLPLYQELQD